MNNMKEEYKKIAIAFACLVEAKVARTDRVAILSYLGAKGGGVDTADIADTFGRTKSSAYGALAALEKAGLSRQEIRDEMTGKVRNRVGYWFITPYGGDVLRNFKTALA